MLNRVLILNKPAGISSAKALNRAKRALGVKKAGHAGTLDPFATGVLVCCFGGATRLARFFLSDQKRYDAEMVLGIRTDTQDLTGAVIDSVPLEGFDLSDDRIMAAAEGFAGEIEQAPPVYSALKHEGVPLYRLARQGRPVQKPPRKVTIHEIRVTEIRLPSVRLEVECSSGTYIRTLCADMGDLLGPGGHLKELHRTRSSGFSAEEAVTLERLEAAADREELQELLIPMADALRGMAGFQADAALARRIANGERLNGFIPEGLSRPDVPIKVVDDKNRLLAVLSRKNEAREYHYCCVFHP